MADHLHHRRTPDLAVESTTIECVPDADFVVTGAKWCAAYSRVDDMGCVMSATNSRTRSQTEVDRTPMADGH
jgi:hypothetical protein